MRLAFTYDAFVYQKYGGIPRYFVQLVSSLAASNHPIDPRIVAPLHINSYLSSLKPPVAMWGLRLPQIRGSYSLAKSVSNKLSPVIINSFKPDIIHQTYYGPIYDTARRPLRVLTVFDMIHEIYSEYFPHGDQTTHLKRLSVAQADHIIAISHSTKADLIKHFKVNPERISVIHLGVAPLHSSLVSYHERPVSKKPFLLYVGGRKGYKNFFRMLDACKLVPDFFVDFNVVAFGGGSFTSEEMLYIHHLGIPDSSVIHVSGGDNVLADLYSLAALYICPSLYEGFGIPSLEAMFYACPVAVSHSGALPEVVGDCGLYFDPLSPSSIANAISKLIYGGSSVEALAKRGVARSRLFSWQRCADKTYHTYADLV